ncbi:btb poz protein [Fusarium flagelliforme]|uniref:Btb poz protein n=1 Tax=Fusarium flagelliforme TaxID=2675880 RepID=A0A395M819_9HYPO|nr:btb poz protein [Fusarium flagelliforme]
MEDPRDDQTNTVVGIAPDGDLILLVGPEETKLRVRSILLMAASKFFSVMLGSDWKEGNGLRDRDGPYEILLPEDNAAALKIICSIIHHENSEVPQALAADDVLAVAVAADKYDCVNALRFASESWLQHTKGNAGNLMLLTAAAYRFGHAQAFKEITRALILDYDGPYLALSSEKVESVMTLKVLCK